MDPASEPPPEATAITPTGPTPGDPTPEGRIHRTTRRARAEQERLTKRAEETLGRLERARPDTP